MKVLRRKAVLRGAIVLAGALALAVPVQASAALDMFLHLDGIQGESKDSDFANDIDVLAWSWGASKAKDKPASTQDISVTKFVDKASPALLQKLYTGATIPSGQLTIRKAGESPIVFLKFCFTNLRVDSSSTGGSGGEDRLTENVSFSFGSFIERYTVQKADGTAGDSFRFGWDLIRNLQLGETATNGC